MLIVISDLHFTDGTAGEHNVEADAFKVFFEQVSTTANRQLSKKRPIEEIKLLFLGDIFDLLRTEMWLNPVIPEDDRPWGANEAKIEANTNRAFDALINRNREVFNILRGNLKDTFNLPVEPERIYIPGNHDKLCNKYTSLRQKVRQYLGIEPSEARFEHIFKDVNYGVFARHGHEFDSYNYGGTRAYTYKDYMAPCIGDPITTELAVKLPWMLMRMPAIQQLPPVQQNSIRESFQNLENVRPFEAIVEWLLWSVKQNTYVKQVINEVVHTVINEFNRLRFVQEWYKQHDTWRLLEYIDKFQLLLDGLKHLDLKQVEMAFPVIAKLKAISLGDKHTGAAAHEGKMLDHCYQYIVYGHTHWPVQESLRVTDTNNGKCESVYLNSGTWRVSYQRSQSQLSFIGWKNLTYLTFYTKEERGKNFPVFESWTGTLKTV